MTRNFDVFFDLRLNEMCNEQSKRRLFESPSRPLWRHYNLERCGSDVFVIARLNKLQKKKLSSCRRCESCRYCDVTVIRQVSHLFRLRLIGAAIMFKH